MPNYKAINMEYLRRNEELPKVFLFEFDGRRFIGGSEVYSPSLFEDSFHFARHLKSLVRGKVLEVGTGTGIIAIACADASDSVLAVDISVDSISFCRANIELNQFTNKISARVSDVFSALNNSEKFDFIFWNTPFSFATSEQCNSPLFRALFDPYYKGIATYLSEAFEHTTPEGRVLFGFSRCSGQYDELLKIADNAGLQLEVLRAWELPPDPLADNTPFIIELFEARQNVVHSCKRLESE